jgi:DNA helicase IV
MTFVRAKKIKNQEYAYLVENQWTPIGSRQKTIKYLGKVQKIGESPIHKDITNLSFKEAIKTLIAQTLTNAGFKEEGHYIKEGITVDLNNLSIMQNNKKIVVQINQGFLCTETYEQLLNFKPLEKHQETAINLAKTLLEAGLVVSEQTFVQLFEKLKPIEIPKIETFYY